ncbi:MAG: hypothetical protein AAF331_15410 [Pseudomonadota bacterium]
MPIAFFTSLELDLIYADWSGSISLSVFRQSFQSYLADRHYKAGRPELINTANVKEFDVDFKKVWAALRLVNAQSPLQKTKTRTVVIAPQDVIFGTARMFQTLAENADGIKVEVCRTEAEALAALNLPYTSVEAMLDAETFLPPDPVSDPSELGPT